MFWLNFQCCDLFDFGCSDHPKKKLLMFWPFDVLIFDVPTYSSCFWFAIILKCAILKLKDVVVWQRVWSLGCLNSFLVWSKCQQGSQRTSQRNDGQIEQHYSGLFLDGWQLIEFEDNSKKNSVTDKSQPGKNRNTNWNFCVVILHLIWSLCHLIY